MERRDYCGKREAGRSCQATTTTTFTSTGICTETPQSILPSYDKLCEAYAKPQEASIFRWIIETYPFHPLHRVTCSQHRKVVMCRSLA